VLAARVSGALSLQWTYHRGSRRGGRRDVLVLEPAAGLHAHHVQRQRHVQPRRSRRDHGSQQVSDSVVVHIANEPPSLKIAAPVEWQVFRVGTPVALTRRSLTPARTTATPASSPGTTAASRTTRRPARPATARARSPAPGCSASTSPCADDDGGTDTQPVMVVVYDPDGGFVTAGGHFSSPAGALADDPQASGRAHFEFNPKYKKGDTGPSPSGGKVKFRLDFASFDLDAQTLEWLVVTSRRQGSRQGHGDDQRHAGLRLRAVRPRPRCRARRMRSGWLTVATVAGAGTAGERALRLQRERELRSRPGGAAATVRRIDPGPQVASATGRPWSRGPVRRLGSTDGREPRPVRSERRFTIGGGCFTSGGAVQGEHHANTCHDHRHCRR